MFAHSRSLSSGTSTQRKPSGASPGGLWAGLVQSFLGSFVSSAPMACKTPTPAMEQSIQKSNGSTFTVPCLSVRTVCGPEYVAASKLCPVAGVESPPSVVTAPGGVTQRRGTRNHLQWLEVRLFLQAGPVRSGVPS